MRGREGERERKEGERTDRLKNRQGCGRVRERWKMEVERGGRECEG